MTRKRFPVSTCLVVALALVAAGCGGQQFPSAGPRPSTPPSTVVDAGSSPRARLLAAVGRIEETKTARISLNMSIVAGNRTETMTGSGEIDVVARRLQLALQGSSGDGSSVELRIVGGAVYVDAGEGWTTLPYQTATEAQTPDPTSALDYLQGVAGDVHVVGTGVVRGAYATRYSATVDLGRALRFARGAGQRAALGVAVDVFGSVKIPTTVWIDELGRVRKVQMSIDLSAVAQKFGLPSGMHAKIDESVEFYDFGVAVDIQAPAGARSAIAAAQDRGAQSDLRNALTAEKTLYTDSQIYSADVTMLKPIEPSLDWGGKLSVVVGPAEGVDAQTVCVSERSKSETTFALADVASGATAGTYYGTTGCPPAIDGSSFSGFSETGWK